jgi:hypothetical protein
MHAVPGLILTPRIREVCVAALARCVYVVAGVSERPVSGVLNIPSRLATAGDAAATRAYFG